MAGTTLPQNFSECIAEGGGEFESPTLGRTCLIDWCESADPERFADCLQVGGGETAGADRCCKIDYPESSCPCLGNLCD